MMPARPMRRVLARARRVLPRPWMVALLVLRLRCVLALLLLLHGGATVVHDLARLCVGGNGKQDKETQNAHSAS